MLDLHDLRINTFKTPHSEGFFSTNGTKIINQRE